MQSTPTPCAALKAAAASTRNREDRELLNKLSGYVEAYVMTSAYGDNAKVREQILALSDPATHFVSSPAKLLARVLRQQYDFRPAQFDYCLHELYEGTEGVQVSIGRFNYNGIQGTKSVRSGYARDLVTPIYRHIRWSTPVYTHHGWVQSSLLDILKADEWYHLRYNVLRPSFIVQYNTVDARGKRYPMAQAVDAFTGKVVFEDSGKDFAGAISRVRKALKERRTGYFLMRGFVVNGPDFNQTGFAKGAAVAAPRQPARVQS